MRSAFSAAATDAPVIAAARGRTPHPRSTTGTPAPSEACRRLNSCRTIPCPAASSPTASVVAPCTASASSSPATLKPASVSTLRNAAGCGVRTRTVLPPERSMNSPTVVDAISLPWPMTTSRSAVSAISESRWLDTNTVRPSPASVRIMRAHPPDAFGIQAVDRFVEQQHGRVADQRGRDTEALAHAQRQRAGPRVGHRGQPDHAEHLVDAPRRQGGCSPRSSAGGCAPTGWGEPAGRRAGRRPCAAGRSARDTVSRRWWRCRRSAGPVPAPSASWWSCRRRWGRGNR